MSHICTMLYAFEFWIVLIAALKINVARTALTKDVPEDAASIDATGPWHSSLLATTSRCCRWYGWARATGKSQTSGVVELSQFDQAALYQVELRLFHNSGLST